MQDLKDLNHRDVEAFFAEGDYTAEETHYLQEQSRRLAHVVNVIVGLMRREGWQANEEFRLLDIGPHFLTYVLRYHLGRDFILNTIGWTDERFARDNIVQNHVDFDLNDSCHQERWPQGDTHHIVVIAEVIEHLFTTPKFTLRMARSLLRPSGYLVIQTPNGVAIRKRAEMLRGRNPFEMIRDTPNPPGHFREYTAGELRQLCDAAGLHCEELHHEDYWPEKGIYRLLEKIRPSFRGGLTAVCRTRE